MRPAFPSASSPSRAKGSPRRRSAISPNIQIRNQVASVPGASVPQPFGGTVRQIMVYTDPYKLEAHQLSLMDVVRSINLANLILPAGDVQIGRLRLQHLHQQPARRPSREIEATAHQDRRTQVPSASPISARPVDAQQFRPTSSASTASDRSTFPSSSRAEIPTPSLSSTE